MLEFKLGCYKLAVFKAFREVLIEVLSFGFGVAELVLVRLLVVLLIDVFSLIHTVIYDAYKQTHNQEKEIKALSLSSNRKQLRYGDRSNILGWFPNSMAKTMLGMLWQSFGSIGGCLAHEMIGYREV